MLLVKNVSYQVYILVSKTGISGSQFDSNSISVFWYITKSSQSQSHMNLLELDD